MDYRFPGVGFLSSVGGGSFGRVGAVEKDKTQRDTDGVNFDCYDCDHKTYSRGGTEDRLKHGEPEEADCRGTGNKGRYSGVGVVVALE